MTRVLAIDLGGTNLRSAVHAGDILAMKMASREPAPASLDAFVARIRALSDAAGGIEALGIAIPGLAEGTICRWVPNLSYLDGVDLEALFPGLTIALGNDAQIALLAEAAEGAARGVSDAILLAIGTGIGSALLYNGTLVPNTELGHLEIDGKEAERLGLVTFCAPREDVLPRALAIAARLAGGSQAAIRATKKSLNNWMRMAGPVFDNSLALEMLCFMGADAKEGVDALRNKRQPSFPSARMPS